MDKLLKLKLLRGTGTEQKIPRRQLKDTSNCINLSDSYLLKNCGVNRYVFHQLLNILRPVMPKSTRTNCIPFPLKLFLTLSFLASGSHQKTVGKEFNINVCQKSISKVIIIIIEALNDVMNDWIVFPAKLNHRKSVKEGFYRKYHFPETIGCIDGTYVEIVHPREDEEAFYDRRQVYSIHAQIVCDADTRIIAICSRFGGGSSNAYIWSRMNIREFVENISKEGEASWLIADSKYPQRPWLMTPIQHAVQGTHESQYNHFHGRTKTCIDKCIGKLKGRWKCLQKKPLYYSPHRTAKIINACAVLHNLCINAGVPDPELYIEQEPSSIVDELMEVPEDINDYYLGIEVRRQLAEKIYYSV